MKKLFFLAVLSVALAPGAFALTLTLPSGGYGPYQSGVGGEFTFTISDTPSVSALIGSYGAGVNVNSIPNSFQSFCVEGSEFISAGGSYTAVYNNHSVYSNVQLTRGAAYLYSQFAQGILSGYNFSGSAAARRTSADLLQRAIWHYMGGQENQGTFNSSNPFEVAAATFFGSEGNANSAADTGYDNVYVLNMWDSNGKAAQDQLIYTTGAIPNVIPDGGMTAMLLGIGFTGVAFISRRLRR